MKEEKEKQNYETPTVEETTMVSKELMDSMQGALSKATETINKLREDNASANDKYIRALADYQNLKRISDNKIATAKDSGKVAVIKELLPIIDNFEKAMESEEVTEGIKLIYNGFKSVLSSNGVEVINPTEGETFNDSVHEAVAPIPGDEEKKNTIAFTQFKGYKMGDIILRYAKVGVYV